MKKQRLDLALVERGLVDSRSKAQSLIMARRVLVNDAFVDKAGANVGEEDELKIAELEHPWVGRGGMKLAHAIKEFANRCRRKSVRGHRRVDGRVHGRDAQARSEEGVRDRRRLRAARRLAAQRSARGQSGEGERAQSDRHADFEETIEFVSIDVSFISLKLILPAVTTFLRGELVALIKPQFEVGKHEVGKGGIVRDDAKRQSAIEGVVSAAREIGFEVKGVIESPVKGAEGNVEFLMHAAKNIREALPATTPDALP